MLTKLKENYKELDANLQRYFLNKAILLIASFLVGVILTIILRMVEVLLLVIVAVMALLIWYFMIFLKCIKDKVMLVKGTVEEIHTQSDKKWMIDRPYILIKTEYKEYVMLYSGNRWKLKEGNYVGLYTAIDSLIKVNEDTFNCYSPILVAILKTNVLKKEVQEESEE